ncbi:L-2-hydroxyglutarate oxidase [[Pseudomonas] carboxydohydrogena]|uniref:L-2-hydroxyglutarate oxidase n=1 Tax=Afipia carboxydohydrogena TaxID=290 RepID=A0ABY8BS52_AFICR|nr:L-2-hydroxyglutarate oxidase [[Pseudomonas] carboxydohydrogena]WEF52421.1 L-2-hydroxyglutarate oxidase [[Pseudomonas] carboxydohydrogena]
MSYTHCVIGGGIVGLATATEILRRDSGARIVLVEKENSFAFHQTGHNSGVIHAGIYYAPGSLKAQLCREGEMATKEFCTARNIPFETCGKLIVATDSVEMERMQTLIGRAEQNGISIEEVSATRLRQLEPNITGDGAILVHTTGIVDYRQICVAMAEELRQHGARVMTGVAVTQIEEGERSVAVMLDSGDRLTADRLIACAGLQSDRIARMGGLNPTHRIVPFRGEYFTLPPSRSSIVKHLIYPVPDPDLQFLGIHLTRMIDGRITIGPNAVLGFHREGYAKGSVNLPDVFSMASFGGFWKLIFQHSRAALSEFGNSISRRRYLDLCRKYCPGLTLADMGQPGAGIRAQAVMADGSLLQDFLFLNTSRQVHVCNAPSPAATSAIPIARKIVDRLDVATVSPA